MPSSERKDRLPFIGLVLLVLYNLLFFSAKFAPGVLNGIHVIPYEGIKESLGFFTLLELLGVAGVFIDLIVRYDELGQANLAQRRFRLFITSLLVVGFFFKLFVNYVDSAYLPI